MASGALLVFVPVTWSPSLFNGLSPIKTLFEFCSSEPLADFTPILKNGKNANIKYLVAG
jgi:hypothetical protein